MRSTKLKKYSTFLYLILGRFIRLVKRKKKGLFSKPKLTQRHRNQKFALTVKNAFLLGGGEEWEGGSESLVVKGLIKDLVTPRGGVFFWPERL